MKPGSLPADPFGRTTDKVKMNPGYQNPDLIEPAGPIDPDVSVLSVQIARRAGRSPCWPTTRSTTSAAFRRCRPTISARLPSASATLLGEAKASPAFVGIMSNGTSGDINNVNFAGMPPGKRSVRRTDPGRRRQRGPGAAFAAYEKIDQHRDWVPLAMAEKEIELGVRRPGRKTWPGPRRSWPRPKTPVLKTLPEIYARETVLLAKYPATVTVKLQAMRIGELGIVAIPCETFAEIGLEIKRKSPLQADVHDRAGQRLQRLPADAGAARSWAATKPGGPGRATWKSTPRRKS